MVAAVIVAGFPAANAERLVRYRVGERITVTEGREVYEKLEGGAGLAGALGRPG